MCSTIYTQTYSEWKNYYLSQYKHDNFTTSANVVKRLTTKGGPNPFPEALDWRNKNAVSPVKNQVGVLFDDGIIMRICSEVRNGYRSKLPYAIRIRTKTMCNTQLKACTNTEITV